VWRGRGWGGRASWEGRPGKRGGEESTQPWVGCGWVGCGWVGVEHPGGLNTRSRNTSRPSVQETLPSSAQRMAFGKDKGATMLDAEAGGRSGGGASAKPRAHCMTCFLLWFITFISFAALIMAAWASWGGLNTRSRGGWGWGWGRSWGVGKELEGVRRGRSPHVL
jgi:hypothetical protein